MLPQILTPYELLPITIVSRIILHNSQFNRSTTGIHLGRLCCHVNIPTVPMGLSQQGQVIAMSTYKSL